jgi:ferritin
MANLSVRNNRKDYHASPSSVEAVAGHLSDREETMLIEKINAPAKKISSHGSRQQERQTVQEKKVMSKVMSLDDLANRKG